MSGGIVIPVPDPRPWVEVLLPGNGGKVRGRVAALEHRPDAGLWVEVEFSRWQRWSTQVEVGSPAVEGIGPQVTRMWAPALAVVSDEDDVERLRPLVHGRLASAG